MSFNFNYNNSCVNYTDIKSCYLDSNCAWCFDHYGNFSSCVGNYKCFETEDCYSQKNEICGIVNMLHNIILVSGFITSSILIFTGVSKYLVRYYNFNNEIITSLACSMILIIAVPVISILFFYNSIFVPAFITYLCFSFLFNFILFR